MSETRQLLEYVASGSAALEIDPDKGEIRGVRILGLESANGRSYLREGVRKAIGLYEGKAVNIDHPSKPGEATPFARRFGWLEGVKEDTDGGLRGNLRFIPTHERAADLCWAAKNRPELFGLSHNASGKTRRENGREIVESIDAVHSVDLVADPASVSSLKESKTMKRKVRDLIECLCKTRPGYARGLLEEAEAGVLSPDMEMDEPAAVETPPAEPADHEAALKAGFRAAIIACLDDDALDMKAKVKKIGEILKMEEKMLGDKGEDKGGDKPADAPASDAASESKKALAGALLEVKAYKLLAMKNIKPTLLFEKALKGCTTEKEVSELIESLPTAVVGGARSSDWNPGKDKNGAGKDSLIQEQKAPEDHKALQRWLHE